MLVCFVLNARPEWRREDNENYKGVKVVKIGWPTASLTQGPASAQDEVWRSHRKSPRE